MSKPQLKPTEQERPMSMLQRAMQMGQKALSGPGALSQEEVELIFAFLNNQITEGQACRAYPRPLPPTTFRARVVSALRVLCDRGVLRLSLEAKKS